MLTIERHDNGRWYDCANRPDLTDYLTEFFRVRAAKARGGRATTEAKRQAARANGAKHTGKQTAIKG
jgi:hypothetical protein